MSGTKNIILDNRAKIQAAYQGGKKVIELDGRKFKIERLDTKVVKYDAEGNRKVFPESWLKVAPADGSLSPCGQIERSNNTRTRV